MWQKIKALIVLLAVALLLVVSMQNTQPTETRFLTLTYTVPLAVWLFLAAGVGFLAGALATAWFLARRRTVSR